MPAALYIDFRSSVSPTLICVGIGVAIVLAVWPPFATCSSSCLQYLLRPLRFRLSLVRLFRQRDYRI